MASPGFGTGTVGATILAILSSVSSSSNWYNSHSTVICKAKGTGLALQNLRLIFAKWPQKY